MSRLSWSRLGLPLLAALLAPGTAGCGEKACLEWTEPALACPSREEALARLTPACGDIVVESVDGEGEFDTVENECCYEVTVFDPPEYSCGPPPPATSSSSGDAGACLTCRQWLDDQNATYDDLCLPAKDLYDQLATCVCFQSCEAECFDTACSGTPGPPTCSACIDSKCAVELDACAADL